MSGSGVVATVTGPPEDELDEELLDDDEELDDELLLLEEEDEDDPPELLDEDVERPSSFVASGTWIPQAENVTSTTAKEMYIRFRMIHSSRSL